MKGRLKKKGKRRGLFKLAFGHIEEERKEEHFSLSSVWLKRARERWKKVRGLRKGRESSFKVFLFVKRGVRGEVRLCLFGGDESCHCGWIEGVSKALLCVLV